MPLIYLHLSIAKDATDRLGHPAIDSQLGSYLGGAISPDAHFMSSASRSDTHFFDLQASDCESGASSIFKTNPGLARGVDIDAATRSFVAGYLCHLAVDEVSRRASYEMMQKLGISSWADLPVPGGVVLGAFAALTRELYGDFSAVASALEDASIPNVLAHVSLDDFQAMWEVFGEWILNGCPHELRIEVLRRMGRTTAQIEAACREHEMHWDAAVAFARESGEVERTVDLGVQRSLEVVPRLWAHSV